MVSKKDMVRMERQIARMRAILLKVHGGPRHRTREMKSIDGLLDAYVSGMKIMVDANDELRKYLHTQCLAHEDEPGVPRHEIRAMKKALKTNAYLAADWLKPDGPIMPITRSLRNAAGAYRRIVETLGY